MRLVGPTRGEENVTGKIDNYPDSEETLITAYRVILPGIVPTRSNVERPFIVDRIMPIKCYEAPFVVWIDAEPYAGFGNREDAYDAIHAWRARWPAASGKTFHVVAK